ncbi:NAD-dependent epimerase/dehydratase family protein [Acinetobacter johnsonii]|uniref:NAD-dependent epimerase/dehydratase family protein n=1 Tax=Acinetobacter johnsonii TaxID=40214 RepID=UPI00309FDE4D
MKILITGASGFVGQALISTLKKNKEYQLYTLLRKKNSEFSSDICQIILQKNTDEPFKSEVFNTNDIDIVIHLAGRAHILNENVENPLQEFRKVNAKGTLELAKQALENKVKRFIFISSIGVNGSSTNGKAFSEQDVPQPHADYAVSKLEAEIALQELFVGTETELVIIRPPLVYAAHAPGNFARFIKLASKNIPLPFVGVNNKRTFVALENLVDFIRTCIKHPDAANQTFLVADKNSISTRELVQYLKQGMGKSARFIYIPQPLMKLGAACIGKSKVYEQLFGSLEVDTTKAQNILGWTAPLTTKQAMLQAGQNYLKMKE